MSASDQYPHPTGPYKVSVKNGFWRDCEHARLQISMCNPKHSGKKFFATCEWASYRFEHTTLIISDTLQRHNLMAAGLPPQEAYEVSRTMGAQWLVDNQQAIDFLPNLVITRWDDWINHKDFPAVQAWVFDLYAQNKEFSECVDRVTQRFFEKRSPTPTDESLTHSLNYVLEEISAFYLMFSAQRAIDVYPGSMPDEPLLWLEQHAGFPKSSRVQIDFITNRGLRPLAPRAA